MIKLVKVGIAAAVLATTSLAAVTPAAARGNGGVAVVAGIIGLGLGAAIASDHPHYRQAQYGYQPAPQPYYSRQQYGYAQQPYGYGYEYGQPQYDYGGNRAYGSGYGQDRGYAYQPDGQRGRYYDQRRRQDVRQRDWDRSDQYRDDRGDEDDDGY